MAVKKPKRIKKKYTKSVIVKLTLFICSAVFAVSIVQMQVKLNDLRGQQDDLQQQIDAYQTANEQLQMEVNQPVDNAFIAQLAHDKLQYALPQEIIFYNNLYN